MSIVKYSYGKYKNKHLSALMQALHVSMNHPSSVSPYMPPLIREMLRWKLCRLY